MGRGGGGGGVNHCNHSSKQLFSAPPSFPVLLSRKLESQFKFPVITKMPQVSKAIDDPYAQANLTRPATGGVSLGAGAAAQAAVLNAAALEGPSVLHCQLCQVSVLYPFSD